MQKLAYLRKILDTKKTTPANINADVTETGKLPNGEVTIMVKNGKKFFAK